MCKFLKRLFGKKESTKTIEAKVEHTWTKEEINAAFANWLAKINFKKEYATVTKFIKTWSGPGVPEYDYHFITNEITAFVKSVKLLKISFDDADFTKFIKSF